MKIFKLNEVLAERLRAAGLRVSLEDHAYKGYSDDKAVTRSTICIRSNLQAALKTMDLIESRQLPCEYKGNRDRSLTALTEDAGADRGGSLARLRDDLNGKIDMSEFQRERDRLVASGLLGKLHTQLEAVSPKRKRRLSEHDGEFELSRRYEIQPFQATYRTQSEERVMEVVCNFSISAWASAADINKYGAIVWALIDIIENAGIRTRVRWVQKGLHIDREKQGLQILQEFLLKEPWEYLPPSLLAATFTSRFYRRLSFGLIPLMADLGGKQVNDSLGHTISEPTPIAFSDGVLTLGPDSIKGFTEPMEAQLLAAIGWKGNAA